MQLCNKGRAEVHNGEIESHADIDKWGDIHARSI